MAKRRLDYHGYKALLEQVYERDKYTCRVCGLRSMLQAHHVIFRSHQGKDELNNLIVLCLHCHEAAHKSHIWIKYDDELKDFVITRKMSWEPKHRVR